VNTIGIEHCGTKLELEYAVHGAPPVQLHYRKTQFLPAFLQVTFVDGKYIGAELRGPGAKKDGTPGINHHENHYGPTWAPEPLPAWAVPFTEWHGQWPIPAKHGEATP
jgi:hypothetical protein